MHDVGKEMFYRRYAVMLLFYTSNGHLSWPNKWEHASFAGNKTSVQFAQKNLADLHCTFFMQHQNNRNHLSPYIQCSVEIRYRRPIKSGEKYNQQLIQNKTESHRASLVYYLMVSVLIHPIVKTLAPISQQNQAKYIFVLILNK